MYKTIEPAECLMFIKEIVLLLLVIITGLAHKEFLTIANALLNVPYFFVGLISFVFVYFAYLKPKLHFITTLDHELSHAFFALLFGNRVDELYATNGKGGHISHVGMRGDFLISLAPYFFRIPVALISFMLVLAENKFEDYMTLYQLIFGTLLGYQLVCLLDEARPHQTDLKTVGVTRSYLFIVCLNLIWLSFLIVSVIFQDSSLDLIKQIFFFWEKI